MFISVTLPFEVWFVSAAQYATTFNLAPRDYVWNLQEPGRWRKYFDDGMTPDEAAELFFAKTH